MSVYEAIGGADAVKTAVDDFYLRVVADPELAGFFADTDVKRLKAHQRAFIAAAIGGPEIYRGRDMAAAHAGLEISDRHFGRVVDHLVVTLDRLGVPAETISLIGTTLEPLRADIVTVPSDLPR